MADTCFVTIKNDTNAGLIVISGSETIQEGPEGYEFLHQFYTPLTIQADGGQRLSLKLSSAYDYILYYKLDQAQVGWEINVNNSSEGSLKSVKSKDGKCKRDSDNNDDAVEAAGEGGDGDGGTVNVTIDGDD